MPLETEVKFYIQDRESIRRNIMELGAVSSGRIFEENIRFEDAAHSLIERKSLLRLRKDKKIRLTYKSEPAVPEPAVKDSQFKVFEELETEIGDFTVMRQILEALGFQGVQRYEKWRETFIIGNTCLCLDTMPFGDFLEIEGEKSDIRQLAAKIGMKWEKRILHNYLGIFEGLKKSFHLPFSDISFDNFQGVEEDMASFIRNLESGGG